MKTKNFIFGVLISLIIILLSLSLMLIIDMHFHEKYLNIAGLNYKGYRGKILEKKKEAEIRLALVGGSTAFGYGVKWYEALPPKLQAELQKYYDSIGFKKKISVINLAYNAEGAYAFYYNLKDFLYLDYDYVIIYDGYNDLTLGNTTAYRHANPIFRVFSYMPILPLLINEKIMAIQNKGRLNDAYLKKKIVFKANSKKRIEEQDLNNVLESYNNDLDEIINRLKKISGLNFDYASLRNDKWSWYKHFIKKAIDFSLEHNKKIIVITQPYLNGEYIKQQASLREMLSNEYAGNKNIFYVNLGESISLKNQNLSYDGAHLTAEGFKVMAEIITEKIKDYIKSTTSN